MKWSEQNDPTTWAPIRTRPGLHHLLTIPNWLGGAWAARYIVTHAWTRWLILWPLTKLRQPHADAEKTP